MKNVTLNVDEKVLAAVRRYAAEHDSSVNAMVREFLTGIAEREDRAARARARIRKLSRNSRARVGARTWSRDALHQR
jgi:plasmid stability protein